jgi:hypothetical protein
MKNCFFLCILLNCLDVYADLAYQLKNLKGYTITDVLTITSWYDESEKDTSFRGCRYGRTIVFEGNKILKCASYGYQYAYRPEAIILSNGSDFKMIVESDVYDMRR